MVNTLLGWDIGGAHLKAVLLDGAGVVQAVYQVACPLWQGLEQLDLAIEQVRSSLCVPADMHAVTMTGELADIFPDRRTGVLQISRTMADRFGSPRFYAGHSGFVEYQHVGSQAAVIASANWLASAQFMASRIDSALLVDLGSTTCDLTLLHEGRVCTLGESDAERMRHEELAYTGVVRTPLMAFGSHVPFGGVWSPLAAEYFATAADVYRLTGELPPEFDLATTADGAGKSLQDSARRLARMICRDLEEAGLEQWKMLAFAFRQLQLDRLKAAAMRQYSRGVLSPDAPVLGAGAGCFLVRELARQLGRDYQDATGMVIAATPGLARRGAVCFPAYAVAQLAREVFS